MKIAINYFCYGKDEDVLKQSLKALPFLKKADDDEVDVYLWDQADTPLSTVPNGVNYEQTDFPRPGHLYGAECVYGMLSCYKKALAKKAYDWIIKLDCDTILNDISILCRFEPSKTAIVATDAGEDNHAIGCGYALSPAAVQFILDCFADPELSIRLERMDVFEDIFVSRVLTMSHLDIRYFQSYIYQYDNIIKMFVYDIENNKFVTRDMSFTEARQHVGMNFRAAFNDFVLINKAEDFDPASTAAESLMTSYVDWLEAGCLDDTQVSSAEQNEEHEDGSSAQIDEAQANLDEQTEQE